MVLAERNVLRSIRGTYYSDSAWVGKMYPLQIYLGSNPSTKPHGMAGCHYAISQL